MADEVETVVTVVSDSESGVADLDNNEGASEDAGNETESDAVEVARIEGETAVAIAAISADTEQARIDADLERERLWQETNAEVAALRASMTEREQRIAELEAQLSSAEASQSNPTLQADLAEAALTEAVDATLSEPNLTPPSTAENETATEVGQSAEEESAAVAVAVAVPARKRRRLI